MVQVTREAYVSEGKQYFQFTLKDDAGKLHLFDKFTSLEECERSMLYHLNIWPKKRQCPHCQQAYGAVPELLDLLKRSQRLGLDFSVGNAYISRSYIEAQEALNKQINSLIEKLEGAA